MINRKCLLQVLIADKLDGDLDKPFIYLVWPLLVAFVILIMLSFSAKGGNKCKQKKYQSTPIALSIIISSFTGWFGIRKNFSMFLLNAMPCLQEYGNISYHSSDSQSDRERGQGDSGGDTDSHLSSSNVLVFEKHHDKRSRSLQNKKLDLLKPVVPIVSIEMPD